MLNTLKDQKGHGYFRKSKAYGLVSGIALAGALLASTGAVSADETTETVDTTPEVSVVSESNATNLSDAQADNSQAHTDLASQAGNQTGQLTETITSDSLNQAVSDAKQAGVSVDQSQTVTHNSLADANADLASQTQAVTDATHTQTQIDANQDKAQAAAQNTGVAITQTEGKTYTDNKAALADNKAQTDNLAEVTNAQKQVNEQLPKAVEAATASGVKVTVQAGTKTGDAKKALDDLASQVAQLKDAKTTQESISSQLSQALEAAKQAGVNVTTGNAKTYSDLAKALADAKAQVEKLTAFKDAQTKNNQAVQSAKDAAKQAGVNVTTTDAKTYASIDEAKADSAKQIADLTKAAETQKKATESLASLTQAAKAAGLTIQTTDAKSYASVDEANADMASQTEKLKQAQEAKSKAENQNSSQTQAAKTAQDAANKKINDAVSFATANGTVANITGGIEVSISEAEAKAKEQVDKINQTVAKNKAAQEEYNKKKADIDAKNAKITEENNRKQSQYDQAYAEYQKAKAQYDADLAAKKDGYLSQPSAQTLIFKSEPNAKHTVNKAPATEAELERVTEGMRPITLAAVKSKSSEQYIISKGESIAVTYTNLENSSLDGTKIAKVVYTYTLNDSGYGNELVLAFSDDPTNTLRYLNGDKAFSLNMDVKFYDANGKLIDPTGSLVSFASLNASAPQGGDWEGISDFSGELIPINGSSISVQPDGVAKASVSNSYKSDGSKIDAADWDVDGSPLEHYGAIVGKANKSINFNIRSEGRGYVWFAFNSNIKSIQAPTPPKKPEMTQKVTEEVTPPTPEAVAVQTVHITPETVSVPTTINLHEVKVNASSHDIKLATDASPLTVETTIKTPALTANVHDITVKTAVHPVQVTQKPTSVKSVVNSDDTNINGQTVAKGSTVKWVLQNNKLLAGRQELTAVVMNDPFPSGFEVDSEATQKANETYYTLTTLEDGSYQLVGTANLLEVLNAHRNQDVEVPSFVFIGKPLNDKAQYENTFETIYSTASGYYKVVSNTPKISTPDNPNPVKTVTDALGADVHENTVFDRNVTFHLTTDFSPYVNTVVDVETMAKSAGIYDDTDDKTVKPDVSKATVTDSQGNDITAKGTFYDIEAGQEIPSEIQIFLDGAHLTPDGEFVVWIPNDLKDYYQNYVLKGNNVTVNLPVEVIAAAGEKAENTFVQVEFSNGYQSNLVFVTVPDVSPEKHAISKDGTVLDGQEVGLNQVFNYLLDGVTVPKHHDTLWQYEGLDKLDVEHDRYTGNWKGVITGTEYTAKEDMTLPYDVTLSDGTMVKAGDTIKAGSTYAFTFEFDQDTNDAFLNKIVKVTWDAEKGEWSYSIDQEFLNSLGIEGTFDADFWIEVERIKDGDVENTFINTVNGRELIAKVTTTTPAPEVPETPVQTPDEPVKETPQTITPTKETPVAKASALPMTGESQSVAAILAGGLLTLWGLVGIRRRKEQ